MANVRALLLSSFHSQFFYLTSAIFHTSVNAHDRLCFIPEGILFTLNKCYCLDNVCANQDKPYLAVLWMCVYTTCAKLFSFYAQLFLSHLQHFNITVRWKYFLTGTDPLGISKLSGHYGMRDHPNLLFITCWQLSSCVSTYSSYFSLWRKCIVLRRKSLGRTAADKS